MAINEKALSSDHPNVAHSLSSLAANYDKQGRYAEAKPLHRRALAIRKKVLGPAAERHLFCPQSLNQCRP